MTSDVLDKKQYVTSSRIDVKDAPTFLSLSPTKNNIEQSQEFKRSVVRNQWKYVKSNYDNNPNSRNILQRGDWYEIQGNYKKAIDFYLEALTLDSENISIYKKIINTLIKHNQFNKAEEYFKVLLSKTNQYEILKDYVVFKVSSLSELSNIDYIIGLIDSALSREEEDVDLMALKGFLLMNLKADIHGAKKLFEKVIKINKNYIHAVNNLGVCYLREKTYEKAISYFKKAIEINPYNYPFSYQNLANSYIEQKDIDGALNILDLAVTKNVSIDNNYLHLFAWLLLENLQLIKAKTLYEKLIKSEPENNLLYNNLGVCYLREGNIDIANDYFKKAVSLFSAQSRKGIIKDIRSLNAFYNIGRVAISKRDLSTIKEMSKIILEIDPKNVYGLYFEGNYWLQNEDYNGAIDSYEKALSVSKEIPEIYPDYSFILTAIKNNQEKAVEMLEEAMKIGYKSNFIINNLVVAYVKLGDFKKSAALLVEYEDDEFISFYATKGLLEMRKGNLEKGVSYYEKAIDLFRGVNKKIASQILFYELALYWFNKNDMEKALENLNKSKTYEKSYVNNDIQELEDKINHKLNI